jgi:hypothetical protein
MNEVVTQLITGGFTLLRKERGEGLVIDLCRRNVVIRLVCDRGEYFIRLRPAADDGEWYDSDIILNALINVAVVPSIGSSERSLDVVVPLLLQNLEDIDKAFEVNQMPKTRRTLHAAEVASRRRIFGF